MSKLQRALKKVSPVVFLSGLLIFLGVYKKSSGKFSMVNARATKICSLPAERVETATR